MMPRRKHTEWHEAKIQADMTTIEPIHLLLHKQILDIKQGSCDIATCLSQSQWTNVNVSFIIPLETKVMQQLCFSRTHFTNVTKQPVSFKSPLY